MPETVLTMRRAVRLKFKSEYKDCKGHGGYDALGLIWGVSGGMAWQFVNEEYFWPTDKRIEKIVLLIASRLGIRISNRADLWSMPVKELTWRLENREQVNG